MEGEQIGEWRGRKKGKWKRVDERRETGTGRERAISKGRVGHRCLVV